jgi:hypothetical protein
VVGPEGAAVEAGEEGKEVEEVEEEEDWMVEKPYLENSGRVGAARRMAHCSSTVEWERIACRQCSSSVSWGGANVIFYFNNKFCVFNIFSAITVFAITHRGL